MSPGPKCQWRLLQITAEWLAFLCQRDKRKTCNKRKTLRLRLSSFIEATECWWSDDTFPLSLQLYLSCKLPLHAQVPGTDRNIRRKIKDQSLLLIVLYMLQTADALLFLQWTGTACGCLEKQKLALTFLQCCWMKKYRRWFHLIMKLPVWEKTWMRNKKKAVKSWSVKQIYCPAVRQRT